MRGRRALPVAVAAIAVLALAVGPAPAQTRQRMAAAGNLWFPLQIGNHWVYSRAGVPATSTWKAEVVDQVRAADGRIYFALDGYFGPRRLVRAASSGAVSEYSPGRRQYNLWYLLGAPPGASWVLQLAPLPTLGPMADCISGSKATLASRTETVKVPAGEFRDVVRVDYQSPCADAGLVSEWFAPGVGLVRREEASFAGPVVSALVEAKLGDLSLPHLPYSASLALERPAYFNNLMPPVGPNAIPVVRGAFILSNRTPIPVDFLFAGCVSVYIDVRNEAGELVLTANASDGGCCECDSLLPYRLVNDTLVVPVSFRLQTEAGDPLPDGFYSITATLDDIAKPRLDPAASVRIEVQTVY